MQFRIDCNLCPTVGFQGWSTRDSDPLLKQPEMDDPC